jgi:hypothetical protein
MIVAIAALSVSLVGTAVAGPIAEISVFNKKDKQQIRKISRNISNRVSNRKITQRAPGLSVAAANLANIASVANVAHKATNATNAENAEKLGGQGPGDYVTQTELLWALVDGDTGAASIVRSNGATGASSPGTGRYVVTFNRNISSCGIVATLGDATGTTGSPGEISLDQPVGSSIEVNTYNSEGTAANTAGTNGFYIQVTC